MSTEPSLPLVLSDHVAEHIRNQVFTGRLKAGEPLDPVTLSIELGVSRQPVREAIITLASEGLVDRRPRRIAVVAALTPDDILDHYASFGLLSGIAAARAATRIGDDDVVRFNSLVTRMRSTSSVVEQAALGREFHAAVNHLGATRRLRSLLRLLNKGIPTQSFDMSPEWVSRADHEHTLILDALVTHDAETARRLTTEHFAAGGADAVHALTVAGFWDSAAADRAVATP
jgi:DNA-binding GntR family transcriptional regulator